MHLAHLLISLHVLISMLGCIEYIIVVSLTDLKIYSLSFNVVLGKTIVFFYGLSLSIYRFVDNCKYDKMHACT